LQHVVITIDGTEQTYNQVKSYVYRGVNAFERVLQNIGLLTAAGIRVLIRLNVDMYNIGEMGELVELLHQRFGTNANLYVSSFVLYGGERSPEDSATLFAQRMQLEQQIAQCGYRSKRKLLNDIKVNCCWADDDGESVIIVPDGHLGKCEHCIDREFFGHIDSEERDEAIIRKFKERRAEIEACATCFYYPQCIRLVMCEKYFCSPEYQQEHLHETMEAMKYEYERYLSNESHSPYSIKV
jgi:radical SAM protein with 4Fe4S-binding SPASM domain